MTHQEHLDAQLDRHVKRAQSLISHRMADARAHLVMGDEALAGRRLSELLDALATAPDAARNLPARGLLPEVAERAYRDALTLTPFDPAKHDPAWRSPTREGAAAARSVGAEARGEAAKLIGRARAMLPLVAGDRGAVDAWHEDYRSALTRWAKTAVSGHQLRVFHAVRHMRLRPELRGG